MNETTASKVKSAFWEELNRSPFVMLELEGAPHTAVPMTAQLDKEAHGAIWFFTASDKGLGRLGPATATYSAKDHKLFARFAGRLTEEKSRERFEKFWSNAVAAWFPEGKDSPTVLLMRMDLGAASIWDAKLGPLTLTQMLLGIDVRDKVQGHHAETTL